MTTYDNTNTGILSKNDRKETDTHPDYKGQIDIEGAEYWLAGWIKERKDGSGKFISLKFTAKEDKRQEPKRQEPKPAGFDDDIGF